MFLVQHLRLSIFSAKGGFSEELVSHSQQSLLSSTVNVISGNGASLSEADSSKGRSNQSNCADCFVMNGRVVNDSNLMIAGVCPSTRQWNLSGGYGGGGASCGPGGGGGGGFRGASVHFVFYFSNLIEFRRSRQIHGIRRRRIKFHFY